MTALQRTVQSARSTCDRRDVFDHISSQIWPGLQVLLRAFLQLYIPLPMNKIGKCRWLGNSFHCALVFQNISSNPYSSSYQVFPISERSMTWNLRFEFFISVHFKQRHKTRHGMTDVVISPSGKYAHMEMHRRLRTRLTRRGSKKRCPKYHNASHEQTLF